MLSLLQLGWPQAVHAAHVWEDIRFTHLTLADGLSHSQVNSITQDDKGFIWIATQYGLNRYDGSEIITFLNQRDNPNSLADNYLWKVYKGRHDVLWIATFGGLSRFDLKQEIFTNYYHDNKNPNSLAGNQVWSVIEDSRGRVWAATQNGLSRLDPASGVFKNYILPTQDGVVYETTNMTEDHAGGIWIGSNGGGLFRFDPDTENFTGYFHDENNTGSLTDNFVISVHEDSQHNLWVGTYSGLNKMLPDRKKIIRYQHDPKDSESLGDNYVWDILEAENGKLWIGTESGGLSVFDPETERFAVYQPQPGKSSSISSLGVTAIFQDKAGRFWVASYDGINIYNPQRYTFSSYQGNILSDSNILSIYQDDANRLWLGTSKGGLNRIDPATGDKKYYQHDAGNKNSLPGNQVNSIHSDKEGFLWLGTDNGLSRFDPRSETFENYSLPTDDNPDESGVVRAVMAGGNDDTLWLGAVHLYAFNKSTGVFRRYPFIAPKNKEGLAAPWLYSLMRDHAGTVWAGSDGGMTRFDSLVHQFAHYYPDRSTDASISNGLVQSLYQDSNGKIWIGTNDGLNELDPATQRFKAYFERDGLGGNRVLGIATDNENNLWVSHNKGLSRFDPKTKIFRSYDKRDGLVSNQFNVGAVFKNKKGELFFGGQEGLVFFDPARLQENIHAPDVVISGFSLFNKNISAGPESLIKQSVTYLDEITLEHDQSVFGFEFAGLSYWSPMKNKYAYQMEGFDKQPVYVDGMQRFASYTNLDPGRYVFRVKAANNDGVWNNTGTAIRMVILPPWWETLWFKSSMVALFFLSLIVFYNWRVYAIRARNRELESQVRIRTHELADALRAKDDFITTMNHELRTPMSAITGLGALLNMEKLTQVQQDYVGYLNNASRYMMQLINNILDFSQAEQVQFSLDRKPFRLDIALRSIHQLLQQQANQKGLTLLLDNQTDHALVLVGDRVRLEQVLINLLMNGIKYTQDGTVALRVTPLPCEGAATVRLRFSVEDTGPGIPEDQFKRLFEPFTQLDYKVKVPHRGGVGLGLTISKRLVEHMKGTLRVNSVLNKGSVFFFEVDMSLATAADTALAGVGQASVASFRLPEGSRILLVDDSDLNRFVALRLLQNMGAEVGQANSGRNAMLQLQQYTYDLVLLDISLPDMDGMAVTRWIREQSSVPHLPVIALTAHSVEYMKPQCEAAGMDDFLSKPFEYQEMYQVIDRHLSASPCEASPQTN